MREPHQVAIEAQAIKPVESKSSEGKPLKPRENKSKSPSAQAFEDWINVLFDASGRAIRGLTPIAVLAFSVIELVNPDLFGHQHISVELAQTLLGASLGALGIDLIGRRRGR
jgi:hypothetical protein